MEVSKMTIGDNIKKYRKQNNLTQKQLGELIDKSTISIRKYEANDITPSISVLNNIASALNIDTNALLGEKASEIRFNEMIKKYLYTDELLTHKNKLDFKYELDNKISIHYRVSPIELELIYLSKINELEFTIKTQEKMIKHLEDMVKSQNDMINILRGGIDGE